MVIGAAMDTRRSEGSTRSVQEPASRPTPEAANGSENQSPAVMAKAAQATRTGVVCPSERAPGRLGIRATTAAASVVRSAPLAPTAAVRVGSCAPVSSSKAASSTKAADAWAESWTELVLSQGVDLSATAVPTASTRSS